jgi:hypothetical protein
MVSETGKYVELVQPKDQGREDYAKYSSIRVAADDPELKEITSPEDEKGIAKIKSYENPTAHFRMAREEIGKAVKEGIPKVQFPTGETAMNVEGLGENSVWHKIDPTVDPGA